MGRAGGVWWVAKSTGTRFVNERWGEWSTKVTWLNVMAADVNGDGRQDLVGRIRENGSWWAATSTGCSPHKRSRRVCTQDDVFCSSDERW